MEITLSRVDSQGVVEVAEVPHGVEVPEVAEPSESSGVREEAFRTMLVNVKRSRYCISRPLSNKEILPKTLFRYPKADLS